MFDDKEAMACLKPFMEYTKKMLAESPGGQEGAALYVGTIQVMFMMGIDLAYEAGISPPQINDIYTDALNLFAKTVAIPGKLDELRAKVEEMEKDGKSVHTLMFEDIESRDRAKSIIESCGEDEELAVATLKKEGLYNPVPV